MGYKDDFRESNKSFFSYNRRIVKEVLCLIDFRTKRVPPPKELQQIFITEGLHGNDLRSIPDPEIKKLGIIFLLTV